MLLEAAEDGGERLGLRLEIVANGVVGWRGSDIVHAGLIRKKEPPAGSPGAQGAEYSQKLYWATKPPTGIAVITIDSTPKSPASPDDPGTVSAA